jgi:hypothetical protein
MKFKFPIIIIMSKELWDISPNFSFQLSHRNQFEVTDLDNTLPRLKIKKEYK